MADGSLAINPWMILPFGVLLLMIAMAPLFFAAWWLNHYPKIALCLAAVTLTYYLAGLHATSHVWHTAREYISFISLIGSLYVVSGGIHIQVKGQAGPLGNAAFLLIGAVLANVLGTTGASLLLVRPWIRMNRQRIAAHHIVFFIFIVSNVGGCLTPIGDPPLFLGYLLGLPFWWVAQNCLLIWAVGVGLLLLMFLAVDFRSLAAGEYQPKADDDEPTGGWKFEGLSNLVFLGIILAAVFVERPSFLRESLMVGAAMGSWFTTRRSVHQANLFNFHPIQEVAILFFGIFATMMPALDWLRANSGQLAHATPSFFYWSCGALSGALDNAPTYLCFMKSILGHFEVADLLGQPKLDLHITAVSIGAVFFGANTYIGNGPNFMVKSIADQQGIRMPGFLGYILKYTLPFMLPMLVIVWLLFFRG